MSANLTTFCLSELTDYTEFERLSNDLLSVSGYPKIEPLGGFKDKGRDAIYEDKKNTMVFSYSVREDWQAKLFEDANKIVKYGHKCNKYVFVTTSATTATEKDSVKDIIKNKYGWTLDIYDMERLRNLLDAQHPEIKEAYPHIFRKDLLVDQTKNVRTSIVISCDKSDSALADWLTRKLTSEGYLVWYAKNKLLGGERYPDDIDSAIETNAACCVSIYSIDSLSNPEIVRQRTLAANISKKRKTEFLIPIGVHKIPVEKLDSVSGQLVTIPFQNWATGLDQLLKKLIALKVPKVVLDGRNIAANYFLNKGVITDVQELVISNCLVVEKIPNYFLLSSSTQRIEYSDLVSYFDTWAFKITGDHLISFSSPPVELIQKYTLKTEKIEWKTQENILEIPSPNLISELLKKSLHIYCVTKGLAFDRTTKATFFPMGLLRNDSLTYTTQNGKTNRINASGVRKYRRSPSKEQYMYYLSPEFAVSKSVAGRYTVLVRTRVHITDTSGNPLPGHQANARRKDLCKDWWNKEWLSRVLAICEFLADHKMIVIGSNSDDQIVINAVPMILNSPKGINERALNPESFEREDIDVNSSEEDDV